MLYLVCSKYNETNSKMILILCIFLDNVTFSYDDRQTALNAISFTIPKGATVALVGPSGGG